MSILALLIGLILLAVPIVWQLRAALGPQRGTRTGALALLGLLCGVGALALASRSEPPLPESMTATVPLTAQTCAKCHQSHYDSWRNTYHRTMTREATPEYVKGTFDGAPHVHYGVTSHMIREGDQYFLETADPEWLMRNGGTSRADAPRRKLSVDRIVGSHWFQQYLHRDEQGRYVRLPMTYHIVENRWIHTEGAFLAPDSGSFLSKALVWNETCLYCHNTRPVKNPKPIPDQPIGYDTKVGELGISCEACHGAGEHHVRAHQNPMRRLVRRYAGDGDPTIVNPARLSVERADEVCARCHGGPAPRLESWNPRTHADPYLAGRELRRFWFIGWSEADLATQMSGGDRATVPAHPEPLDGRFWGDGTPLTTAVEYQGMALSACYQQGHGKMTCLTCHTMHGNDPDHQLKPGLRATNGACYSCHPTYRDRLAEHTHHPAGSQGSLCYNCHMPFQVYSLLSTHRSHRIVTPRVRDSLGTGKPHACNLCHLDKSLGWTQDQLGKWYGTKPEPLTENERTIASSVLHLTQSDARTRAVVAGAFGWEPAQQASGRDWPGVFLTRALEVERYQAVRYTTHRSLRVLYGAPVNNYEYQAVSEKRAIQLRTIREHLQTVRADPARYPHLPITTAGAFSDDAFNRLLRDRKDPDVNVNE